MNYPFKKTPFLFLFLFFAACITTQSYQESKHSKMSRQVTQDIYVDGNREKGIATLESYLAQYESEYRSKGLKVSLLYIYGQLAQAFAQKGDFGKANSNAQKGLQLINQIESIGLAGIDDDGSGGRISGRQNTGLNLPQNRQLMFNSGRLQVYYALRSYYEAAGDSAKADEWLAKFQAAADSQNQLANQLNKKSYAQFNRKGSGGKPSAPIFDQDQYQKELYKTWALRAEILEKYHTVKMAGIDKMIDRWVRLMQSQDMLAQALDKNIQDARKNGLKDVAADYQRIKDFYNHSVKGPWAKALKASMLYEINRQKKALNLINEALASHDRTRLPNLQTPAGKAWFQQLNVVDTEKAPLPWQVLKAQILTAQKSPKARLEWQNIQKSFLTETKKGPQQIQYSFFRDHYENQAALYLAELHQRERDPGRSLTAIENLLREKESIRASFTVEAHKMGYLSANKRLYERYLKLSRFSPQKNLLGMERAKSRAMVDLMAGDLDKMNDSVLQAAARQQASIRHYLEKKPNASAKRALEQQADKVTQGLQELKNQQPELYSLVSVEVPPMGQLRKLIPEDAAFISYYVTDKILYINVLTRKQHFLKTVDITRGGLFVAVYEFRKRIAKGNDGPSVPRKGSRSMGIDMDWRMDKGIETFSIKNRMPFPLEINSMTRVDHGYFPAKTYPFLLIPMDTQAGIQPLARKVDSLSKQILLKRDRSEEMTGGFITEIFVDTNVGRLHLEAVFVKNEDELPSLTVIEKSKAAFEPLRKSLYDILINPVEKSLQGVRQLVIAPHSMLHFLPFEALRDRKGEYLLGKYAVSYTPSLAVLQQAKAKNHGKMKRLAAFGDSLGDLEGARTEIQQIKKYFPEARIMMGQDVTIENVSRNIGNADVIHFACHGIFNPGEPLKSALVMARKSSASTGSKGQSTADYSLLTVPEIMSLKCQPYLVALSACDTGRARISGGDELIGLQRGFFTAGAPSLITTLWPIADEPTVLLISRFYENLTQNGMNKAVSLQEAKLFLIKNGFQDPYYWSAFVLQGDWE